ncbi:MAG TPA: hypothetical protein VFS52_20740 [Steroidobacteraceae bacterium]|nr:hypothetical protein [Steroidobacteraceae bacterium]
MADKSIEMARRPAKYVNINTRLEKHGDSEVLCADISVRGFHIERGPDDGVATGVERE